MQANVTKARNTTKQLQKICMSSSLTRAYDRRAIIFSPAWYNRLPRSLMRAVEGTWNQEWFMLHSARTSTLDDSILYIYIHDSWHINMPTWTALQVKTAMSAWSLRSFQSQSALNYFQKIPESYDEHTSQTSTPFSLSHNNAYGNMANSRAQR